MKISHYAVKHPAVIGMLLIVLIAFGIYSFVGLNVEFMADISLPTVEIISVYPGAGAEDVERDVTEILEKNFVTLPNFKGISSISRNSFSWITITFRDGIDPYDMLPEIRNRIQQLSSDLPDTLQGDPVAVIGGATMIPIFMASISGGEDTGRLTTYLEDTLLPKITKIQGVSEVSLSGKRELEIRVTLDSQKIQQYGISTINIYQALQYAHVRLPIGTTEYRGHQADLRFDGSISSIEDLSKIPVGTTGESIIFLGDVANITREYAPYSYTVEANGVPRIVLTVQKRADGNAMNIIKEIKRVLEHAHQETHGALTFEILSDDSKSITASLRTVALSGLTGMLMAIFVIFLFLADIRATLTIAISIPLSILFTFIGMRIAGITINLMSLSGIVVALGMIVDGSIVMLEQVMRIRHSTLGECDECIIKGSDQVGSSILASYTTTIAVFIPLALLSGIIGSILRDIALTLILALVASVLVALVVVPFVLRLLLKITIPTQTKISLFDRGFSYVERAYRRAITWTLSNRSFVIISSVALLILILLIGTALGITFIPSTDTGEFFIDLEFPRGYSVAQTEEKARIAQKLVSEHVNEIETIILFSGQNSGYGFSSPHEAYMKAILVPSRDRKRSVHEIILDVQQLLSSQIIDARITTTNGGFDKLVGYITSGGGYGLKLIGTDMETLYETATHIATKLASDQEVLSVTIDTNYDNYALILDVNRTLLDSSGISSAEAGLATTIMFQGIDSGKMHTPTGERYPIRLLSDLSDTPITSDVLSRIFVPSAGGHMVAFSSFSTLKPELTVSQINRKDRAKTVTISAILVSENTAGVFQRMNSYLREHPLPQGIQTETGGLVELIGDAIGPMVTALIIAIFLVYTVMVIQFERFRQPLVVMASIPFCFIGVILGLLIFGSSISLISIMAIIALGGIVVNNAIILIDSINLLREESKNRASSVKEQLDILRWSISEGGSNRLRPILMTTLTTMFGVIPMAIASGEGSAMYAPLGQAIAGGLFSSTLITLFIIPVLYYTIERRLIKRRSYRIKKNSSEDPR